MAQSVGFRIEDFFEDLLFPNIHLSRLQFDFRLSILTYFNIICSFPNYKKPFFTTQSENFKKKLTSFTSVIGRERWLLQSYGSVVAKKNIDEINNAKLVFRSP